MKKKDQIRALKAENKRLERLVEYMNAAIDRHMELGCEASPRTGVEKR